MKLPPKTAARLKRKKSIRKKIWGTETCPRLCVFRSAKHIYAQLIDDDAGKTLAAASTLTPEVRADLKKTGNIKAAERVGALVAQRAAEKGIKQVVFDRNGFLYHGRVKAIATAAREGGLEF
jgi:large subunit ribosomal protein L18